MKTIERHLAAFADLGVLRLQVQKPTAATGGRPEQFALLNEDQAYLLLTMSRNTSRVVALKVALVKSFRDCRMALEAYRAGTLPSFKALQDAIQAVPGGPGPWLHSNVNKLVNATAAVAAGTRVTCDAVKQATLMMLHNAAVRAVSGATDAKDAYAQVRAALEPFALPAN